MHHIPKPQDQARILAAELAKMDVKLPHQFALNIIAKTMGYKDWKTMSAASKEPLAIVPASQVTEEPSAPAPSLATMGPADGKLYESLVTVDMTLSARIQVRAHDEAEAEQLLRAAGQAQYPHGFELDDGNYRGSGDFYLGDPSSITCLSEGEVDYDSEGDRYGCATWTDGEVSYKIIMVRPNSDSSDEETWAEVEVSLYLSRGGQSGVGKTITDYEVHSDNLADWIEECIENGDFDDDFEKLMEQLEQERNLK